MSRELLLQGDIRAAIERWMGDTVSGPWDAVIQGMAIAIVEGQMSTETAARIDLALRVTAGPVDTCPSCHGMLRAEGMRW